MTVTSSNNPAEESVQNILTCSFANPSGDLITQIVWGKDNSVIANYLRSEDDVRYNNTYGEPGDYVMSKPDLDASPGKSTLTVTSVSLDDIGIFNCDVNTLGPTSRDELTLDVYGKFNMYNYTDLSVSDSADALLYGIIRKPYRKKTKRRFWSKL